MTEPGQVYASCNPRGGPRIRVVGKPNPIPGTWGFGKVDVETITADGRGIRRRALELSQLHETATTRDGQPRRTGYALTKENRPDPGWQRRA